MSIFFGNSRFYHFYGFTTFTDVPEFAGLAKSANVFKYTGGWLRRQSTLDWCTRHPWTGSPVYLAKSPWMVVVPAKLIELVDVPGLHKTVVTPHFRVQNRVVFSRKSTILSRVEFVFVGNTVSWSQKGSQNRQELCHFLKRWVHKWTHFEEKSPIKCAENDQNVWKNPLSIFQISTRIQGLGLEK